MTRSRFFTYITSAVLVVAAALMLSASAQAQTFATLANFVGGNGIEPFHGPLAQGTNGNFYGTTIQGGQHDVGVFYEVSPDSKLSDIYNFCSKAHCADGNTPYTSPVLGSDGSFYGTTNIGGGDNNAGIVYKMTIGGRLTTLYSFCPTYPCPDGKYPVGLVQASNGDFYGATSSGGTALNGALFEVNGAGHFKRLYSFCSRQHCVDGADPLSGPMQASNGNFYGTTYAGGSYGYGVLYEMTASGQYKVFYNFCRVGNCTDGSNPVATLVEDSSGNLYGTTSGGGEWGYGTVFEISSQSKYYAVLHSFDRTDGSYPEAALALANDGNLYGATTNSASSGGNIFEVTASGQFTSLYDFCGSSSCTGDQPEGTLIQGTDGTFYGTTAFGGTGTDGTVFSFANGLSPLVKTVPTAAKVGARIIILGNGLTGSTSVTFSGTSATFTVVSDTLIIAYVPTTAASGTVSVTTPTGTLNSNPAFRVTK